MQARASFREMEAESTKTAPRLALPRGLGAATAAAASCDARGRLLCPLAVFLRFARFFFFFIFFSFASLIIFSWPPLASPVVGSSSSRAFSESRARAAPLASLPAAPRRVVAESCSRAVSSKEKELELLLLLSLFEWDVKNTLELLRILHAESTSWSDPDCGSGA